MGVGCLGRQRLCSVIRSWVHVLLVGSVTVLVMAVGAAIRQADPLELVGRWICAMRAHEIFSGHDRCNLADRLRFGQRFYEHPKPRPWFDASDLGDTGAIEQRCGPTSSLLLPVVTPQASREVDVHANPASPIIDTRSCEAVGDTERDCFGHMWFHHAPKTIRRSRIDGVMQHLAHRQVGTHRDDTPRRERHWMFASARRSPLRRRRLHRRGRENQRGRPVNLFSSAVWRGRETTPRVAIRAAMSGRHRCPVHRNSARVLR